MRSAPLSTALFVVGYPVAVGCITRLVPVIRERRRSWFVVHQAATAAIVAGWALRSQTLPTVLNASWFVLVGGAWIVTGVRSRPGHG